jgi:hypothetical protein
MDLKYKCLRETPVLNVWHHNVLVDNQKMHVVENTDVPDSAKNIITLIRDGILIPTDGWLTDCN